MECWSNGVLKYSLYHSSAPFLTLNLNDELNKLHSVPKGTLAAHGKIESINIAFLTEQYLWIDLADKNWCYTTNYNNNF